LAGHFFLNRRESPPAGPQPAPAAVKDEAINAPDLWRTLQADRKTFWEQRQGKRVLVKGRVASWGVEQVWRDNGWWSDVYVYLEHGPDPNRFRQQNVMVLFRRKKPGESGQGDYPGFDLRPTPDGWLAPWSEGSEIRVSALVSPSEKNQDLIVLRDARLE
jgi:hypothetical protein